MKVAIYCRVSTEGQERDGTSQSERGLGNEYIKKI